MPTLDKIKQKITAAINQILKKNIVKAADLVYPPNSQFGDLSLPCFTVAKELKKSPVATAEFLMSKIKINNIISTTKAIGPYLNFTFNKANLAREVIGEILKIKDNYGTNKSGRNKKVMVEYSNVNTHKEYHVGHLRNICFGNAVAKILRANGYKVISVSYINDLGIHVAKTLWALEKFYKSPHTPFIKGVEKEGSKGYFLGKVYLRACQELAKDELAKGAVSLIMKKIASRQGAEYKLWQKTRTWSMAGFAKIYQELGIKFDRTFYESEYLEPGLDLVAKLYKERFLTKSDGAIIADLDKFNLGVLLFLRSDGTALYPVADLPLARDKFKKYKIDKSIYVVDIRQTLYFKQLFKVLELLGYALTRLGTGKKEMVHLSYEFVKLPSGMMSSRTGQVITYEDLREQIIKKAISETKKRHQDWGDKKIKETANKLAIGAIKFEMIKVNADKIITFDINQALRFDGFTAAYLQYTYARINSIIRKSKVHCRGGTGKSQKSIPPWREKIQNLKLENIKEQQLIIKLAKYPEVVKMAGEKYDPAELAKYLFDLARDFNDYYHSVPVLKAKMEVREARLLLIKSVSQVIANSLALLGIEVMKEM